MNLNDRMSNVLRDLHAIKPPLPNEAISLIDLTLLDPNANSSDIISLAEKAHQYKVAALCVLPKHLNLVSQYPIKRATVVNFPSGTESDSDILKTIDEVITYNPHEIDYVFPYHLYLAGNTAAALIACYKIYKHCNDQNLIFKVILETGALPTAEMIYELSSLLIEQGCDFLKTSTGKIATGATIPAVFAILSAIVDSNSSSGIKVSGGVKTKEQALSYMKLSAYMLNRKLDSSCFRLGASTLLNDLLDVKATTIGLDLPQAY